MRTENVAARVSRSCWDESGLLTDTEEVDQGPHRADARPEHDTAFDRLVRVVESEIVPRLLVARGSTPKTAVTPSLRSAAGDIDSPDVIELVRVLLAHDASIALAHVLAVRDSGMSAQDICLRLLAPAARVLGEKWERDECDFVQVTFGLCKLHQVLHRLGPELRPGGESGVREPSRRVLLASIPGEQHTFGIVMVGQFFRADGWDVWNEFPETDGDLVRAVRDCWFAVVGLSVGSDVRLSSVLSAIEAIRNASRNRTVRIMLGGPVLVRRPQLATALGADATAVDGREAVKSAQCLFTSPSPPG